MARGGGGGGPVRDKAAMIAGMAPRAVPGRVCFVSLCWESAAPALPQARAMLREDEGVSLILPADHPACPPEALVLCQITLDVASALDGVGLTAAVAEVLAEAGIACNVVAGHHHDHLFVPEAAAGRALTLLRARAERERPG